MSPAINYEQQKEVTKLEQMQILQKGVKNLCDSGIDKVPAKYVLPVSERPRCDNNSSNDHMLELPVIDFAELQGPNKLEALEYIAKACEDYGFFQVINHGIEGDIVSKMMDVSKSFFELPLEEREKLMSNDMFTPVRYGTSFNQNIDGVFCWRDFLKLSCNRLSPQLLSLWPSSPVEFREAAVDYSKKTKELYGKLMQAILESLSIKNDGGLFVKNDNIEDEEEKLLINEGSQMMVVNCYPACPEPELTLGMPPHSDYGLLTLLLQDQNVEALQIHHNSSWFTVKPIPGSFVVNVGDHLEILSNGRYKSVLHRVLVNSKKSRISVASLHTVSVDSMVRPLQKLINEANPRRYMDTDFNTFLNYISSCEPKCKSFLESRKIY